LIRTCVLLLAGGFWIAAAKLIEWLFDATPPVSWGSAFAVLCLLGPFLLLGSWLRGRRLRGRIYVDLGRLPWRDAYVRTAGVWLIVGAAVGLLGWYAAAPFFAIAAPAFGISQAVNYLAMAGGRVQLVEGGVWRGGLIRWERIIAYRWQNEGELVLITRGGLGQQIRVPCPVPMDRTHEVGAVLDEQGLSPSEEMPSSP
jgi:hypothetical protein